MNSLKLDVDLNEIYALKDFIKENCKIDRQLELAIEEAFVNIVNYSNADYIIVNVEYENKLMIEFIDNGIEFNPTQNKDSDTLPNRDRAKIGGLGILFIKHYVDELIYEYADGENHLRLIKEVEP